VILDRARAAQMIRDRAAAFHFAEAQKATWADLIRALDGTLRAYHFDIKRRRLDNGHDR
jgi:hypothetical protein